MFLRGPITAEDGGADAGAPERREILEGIRKTPGRWQRWIARGLTGIHAALGGSLNRPGELPQFRGISGRGPFLTASWGLEGFATAGLGWWRLPKATRRRLSYAEA